MSSKESTCQQIQLRLYPETLPIRRCSRLPIRYLTWTDNLYEAFVIDSATRQWLIAEDPRSAEQLKARIGHTDDKINRMVYQLYGLTEEEVAVVEKSR